MGAAQPTAVLQRTTSDVKHGHYTRTLPPGFRSTCMKALIHAEAKFGRPVYNIEVAQSWSEISWIPYIHPVTLLMSLYDLYCNDEVLADRVCEQWSLNPAMQCRTDHETDFELFSDRKVKKFSSYVLTEKLDLRPGEQTPTINFDHLKELLLSKDFSR
jgi:hypothetical protein